MQIDRLKLVRAHLSALARQFHAPCNEENTILLSGSLRFLLADGQNNLLAAWKDAGVQGPFLVPSYKIEWVDPLDGLAFCGGGGPGFVDLSVGHKSRTAAAQMDLNSFTNSVRIQSRDKAVKVHELVKYFANKMGGVHLDNTRGGKALDQKFRLLDELLIGMHNVPKMLINDRHPVFHEVFAIAGALLKSESLPFLWQEQAAL